jgi:hypothetical protein
MKTKRLLLAAAFRHLRSGCRQLTTLLLLSALAVLSQATQAQQVPVALNAPVTITGDVIPGMTRLDLPFSIVGADAMRLDLIVPVSGATVTLINPSGEAAVMPGDPRLTFNPGSALRPPLPGGVFALSDLASPADGNWILRLTFAAASAKTVVMATVFARSRYQVGVAIERTTLLVGEAVGVGLVVLDNGTPIRGLLPSLSIGQGGAATPLPAHDDGQGADGLLHDGVYSVDYLFATPGQYTILGSVDIPTANGTIHRTATAAVSVIAPSLQGDATALSTLRGSDSCVSALQVKQSFNVLQAGTYATLIRLGAGNGKVIDLRKSQTLPVGQASTSAIFTAKDIRQALASDGPYTVKLIDSLKIGQDEFALSFRKRDAGVFNVNLADLCSAAIELLPQISITPVLNQGYIASFDLAVPIKVAKAGFYQISFKIVGANGEDIALLNASRNLAAGANNVQINLQSEKFLNIDGPYRAISLVVVGLGSSARISTLGSSAAYTRWQFLPAKNGDLNNDGLVDGADAAVITQFRSIGAAVPGDRRDINRDGLIDLRDARALQGLR